MANLFTLEQFSSLISLFRSDGGRAKCSTIILTAFVNHHPIKFSDNFQLGYQVNIIFPFFFHSKYITHFRKIGNFLLAMQIAFC